MKGRRRKIITRVIVFLLLGAIVNVAVAELFILTNTGLPPVMSEGNSRTWPSTVPNDWPPMNEHMFFDGVAWSWEEFGYRADEGYDQLAMRLYSAGFPLRSLVRESGYEYRTGVGVSGVQRSPSVWRDGVDVRALDSTLALMPLWPGFAINTIFYAAVLWVLFFAPGSVRRTLRRRRGLCPACAYPVGTSPVCTECGKAVTLKGVELT